MKTNRWGITVDSEEPTTGVYSIHEYCQWLSDDFNNCIDLGYEAWLEKHDCPNAEDEDGECEDKECECEYWDDGDSTRLHGDWKKDENGLWEPDKTGEFSCIVGESYIQVIWSRTVETGKRLCSPCFPGQADGDSTGGEFCCYALPADCKY